MTKVDLGEIFKGMLQNNRDTQRFNLSIPIHLIFGSQITLLGQIKDLSLKSAFINVKSSIHMALHDELKFNIANLPGNIDSCIQGSARISRLAVGEGIAIYFTEMDEASSGHLQRLISTGG